MARSRNIKPGFFTNEDLVELDFATRLLFAGLWTVADREGRLQDRPKKIKIDLFPADNLDIDVMLQELHDAKFIVRYEVNGAKYVQIATWSKHQNPHHTEKASEIPDANGEVTVKETLKPKEAQTIDGGNLADSLLLIPDSLIPDSKGETRKRASKKCPADFEVTEDMRTWASLECPTVDVTKATAKFRDHTFKNSITDWTGAWRNWLRRDSESAPGFGRVVGINKQEALEASNAAVAERFLRNNGYATQ